MKTFWVYIRLYLFFLIRVFYLMVWIKLTFIIICTFNKLISYLMDYQVSFPPFEYVELISFGVAVLLALETTYIIDGKKGKILSKTFGFNPENIEG